jgi:hypothetical protein
MDKVEQLLNNRNLLQLDLDDDTYYFGTVNQLDKFISDFHDRKREPNQREGFSWISDSNICLNREFIMFANVKLVIENFNLLNPFKVIHSLYNLDNHEIIFEYKQNEFDFITDKLIMGSRYSCESAKEYYDYAINCTSNLKNPLHVDCLQLGWEDYPDFNITHNIILAIDKISEWIQQEKCVLVFCEAGISRSGACVLAYLLKNMEFDDAYNLLISKRPISKPNLGFISQIKRHCS